MFLNKKVESELIDDTFLGRLAQLVERFPYKEDVGGSSPSTPTIRNAVTDSKTKAPAKCEGFLLCLYTPNLHPLAFN